MSLVRITDPQEESLETPLQCYYAISVALKNTSKVIEQLNETFQMDNERHLKRIRKIKDDSHVSALVCKSDSIVDLNELRSKLIDSDISFDKILKVNVPIRRPITKKQYEMWNSIWPLVFHESMDEKLKLKQLEEHSRIFSMFKSYFLDNNLTLLIVESSEINTEYMEEFIIYESKISILDKIICNQVGTSYPFDHYILKTLRCQPKSQRIPRNQKIPYLLSGCLAILSMEPCVMCSMALLHSRIDCVIYFERNEISGALGSKCFLHAENSLNHHFPVYKIENE